MTDTEVTEEPIEIELPAGGSRLGLILASGMGIVLVALILVLATSETNQGLGPSPLISQAAPLIAGPTVDGAGFDLDDHRGRWVVVNFFSTPVSHASKSIQSSSHSKKRIAHQVRPLW